METIAYRLWTRIDDVWHCTEYTPKKDGTVRCFDLDCTFPTQEEAIEDAAIRIELADEHEWEKRTYRVASRPTYQNYQWPRF